MRTHLNEGNLEKSHMNAIFSEKLHLNLAFDGSACVNTAFSEEAYANEENIRVRLYISMIHLISFIDKLWAITTLEQLLISISILHSCSVSLQITR